MMDFFVCLPSTFGVGSKNAFDFNIFSDRKVKLVGTFGSSKLKIPSSFRKRRKKLPTNTKNR